MKTTKTTHLEKFLKDHKRTCTYWVFSGDRHCSCGRDKAIEELETMKEKFTQLEANGFQYVFPIVIVKE